MSREHVLWAWRAADGTVIQTYVASTETLLRDISGFRGLSGVKPPNGRVPVQVQRDRDGNLIEIPRVAEGQP